MVRKLSILTGVLSIYVFLFTSLTGYANHGVGNSASLERGISTVTAQSFTIELFLTLKKTVPNGFQVFHL
ncbi:hypothetical protein ACOI1C_11310 [Bacillus sp. DJP31]|uniref:hypothetical protein n=1 Tax=Bacillus sp. DJP31 TaxID=3409789 RepID=UPI003BB4B066